MGLQSTNRSDVCNTLNTTSLQHQMPNRAEQRSIHEGKCTGHGNPSIHANKARNGVRVQVLQHLGRVLHIGVAAEVDAEGQLPDAHDLADAEQRIRLADVAARQAQPPKVAILDQRTPQGVQRVPGGRVPRQDQLPQGWGVRGKLRQELHPGLGDRVVLQVEVGNGVKVLNQHLYPLIPEAVIPHIKPRDVLHPHLDAGGQGLGCQPVVGPVHLLHGRLSQAPLQQFQVIIVQVPPADINGGPKQRPGQGLDSELLLQELGMDGLEEGNLDTAVRPLGQVERRLPESVQLQGVRPSGQQQLNNLPLIEVHFGRGLRSVEVTDLCNHCVQGCITVLIGKVGVRTILQQGLNHIAHSG
mmetsp:Transcript_130380/g.225401  ORF Transcript_130380/g.225401 Transcript_130380/m.225401 type:complete len:356 (+) Transcript_130380:544-1611(+)